MTIHSALVLGALLGCGAETAEPAMDPDSTEGDSAGSDTVDFDRNTGALDPCAATTLSATQGIVVVLPVACTRDEIDRGDPAPRERVDPYVSADPELAQRHLE